MPWGMPCCRRWPRGCACHCGRKTRLRAWAETTFALLVENMVNQDDLDTFARRVLQQMEQPFEVFGNFVRVSASMGVAMAGPEHLTAEMLVRDADFALNRAQLEGGGNYQFFDTQMELPLQVTVQDPERELRRVLERRQFEVWYQPIYQLKSGKLEGFESLLRLRRPDGSVGSFKELLAVAEDTGLSITLGRETMDTVCRQLRSWSESGAQDELTLTLNLTERQFYHPEMVAQLAKSLAANAVNPQKLLFEIAENTLNLNPDRGRGDSGPDGGVQGAHRGGQLRFAVCAAQLPCTVAD